MTPLPSARELVPWRDLALDTSWLLVAVILLATGACGGGRPPVDRCAATMSSLQLLEPMCWVDAGAREAAAVPTETSSSPATSMASSAASSRAPFSSAGPPPPR